MSKELEQQSTIFLVEADDDTRAVLKSNLNRYGYHVIVALDEEDALDRVEGGLQADLILVDVVRMSPEDALNIGRRIRKCVHRNGYTPLVVMAEKYGADLEGTDVNVSDNDWVTYLEEPGQLKKLLASLLNKLSN
jgi:CheY-like chemotaxis protein